MSWWLAAAAASTRWLGSYPKVRCAVNCTLRLATLAPVRSQASRTPRSTLRTTPQSSNSARWVPKRPPGQPAGVIPASHHPRLSTVAACVLACTALVARCVRHAELAALDRQRSYHWIGSIRGWKVTGDRDVTYCFKQVLFNQYSTTVIHVHCLAARRTTALTW